jgi:hypothetical protein
MRYLVAPEFSGKLVALSPADIERVGAFLYAVQASDKTQLLESKGNQISLLGDSIYVSKLDQLRLYFTIGRDDEGDYILLLDGTSEQPISTSRGLFAVKNPLTNSALNPTSNPSINPTSNAVLNPKWNVSINPKWTAALNPNWTPSLNPKWNASLNPRWSASINPAWNASLNPKWNASINPRMNVALGGPYLYTKELRQKGYLVRANSEVELTFDLAGENVGHLVRANETVRLQFDTDNEWQAYIVRANEDVAIQYDLEGEWIGLVI